MTAQAPSFSNDLMYNKKTTWSYDTDVHIMRVVYLAVMHERGPYHATQVVYLFHAFHTKHFRSRSSVIRKAVSEFHIMLFVQ